MEERQAEEKPTDTETSGRGEVKPEPRNSKLETRNPRNVAPSVYAPTPLW